MNNLIICTCCKKELTGGVDTFGAIATPMCWDCHSSLLFNEGDPSPLAMWDGLHEAIALEFPDRDICPRCDSKNTERVDTISSDPVIWVCECGGCGETFEVLIPPEK